MNGTVCRAECGPQAEGDKFVGVRRAVYTALLGGYESLIEQPTAANSDVEYVCFTDDPNLTSTSWTIHLVEPLLALDAFRSQRALKIRGHEALADFEETLYIDNSVFLREDPAVILDRWLADGDIAISRHSFRDRVIDEFDEVLELNYDDPNRVNEQLLYYAQLYPDALLERPYWNGMIARRYTPEVQASMNLWFDHVLRFSRRDQLSANVAFSISGVTVVAIEENNNDSVSHQWPAGVQRKAQLTRIGRRRSGPAIAEIARLHREIEQLTTQLTELHERVSEVDAVRTDLATRTLELEQLHSELSASAAALNDARLQLEEVRSDLRATDDQLAAVRADATNLRETVSWRVTKPLRFARRVLKR
jgi:hypothetical protein